MKPKDSRLIRRRGRHEVVTGEICIKRRIEDTLSPGRYEKLDPYKVNVYNEGGFFKPHADSPSGDEMIGTLVLCLPTPHKGGELCVSHDGLVTYLTSHSVLEMLTEFSGPRFTATAFTRLNLLSKDTELPLPTT